MTGNIPSWFGHGFQNLRILRLRSNTFSGELPSGLSSLGSLQILDLAENELEGIIPASLGDLKSMAQPEKNNRYLFYGTNFGRHYYEESIVVNIKAGSQRFTKTLSLLTCIDLSGNRLHGKLPQEITRLAGLVVLNLSGNNLNSQINENISKLHQLSSLDLSRNMLSGPIPSSMSSLSFLGYLNLSNNNFSGRISFVGHLTTFESSSFSGNPGLCGAPLVGQCPGDYPTSAGTAESAIADGYSVDKWFYLAVGLGFAAGILVPCFILIVQRTWSDVCFSFVDKTANGLLYWGQETTAFFKNGGDHNP
ncbi:hypothetical protein P3X46_013605 [Hevea brasiliensis]|uniref:Leucine-rich repeat-containing N-terminal plant-type domain-containing protein n=1 Tax=Hevea brasiliensis TaxID=3981 RepID=A0ABQ9M5U5_HEVBR|nr:receptor-like protein EIX2 isoform X1 [Hevea brasiliensis]XP_058007288.1 receptor-like protein EIX2 isoform X1 [Hevea brasiliensis]XP_058007289.1 receptor-like protein EIX2 isoform X1 [Hevea brasiliensis]XP_058007290.1 receptor-like protein EIX2 isoform X1 [Hevea brasiliensis]XP_058007291.1 receptor-like protein EIX2 isoform X1 [Hevea brasiliensis]XP_058007292.1 receptor-like protein EIX2 isoform X1 [Hevea brasiliensis]XP_058007293.1 receptor-like protein EIX2 isoform X1 [Hevea brasiliensi